jgi:hypothetical protein
LWVGSNPTYLLRMFSALADMVMNICYDDISRLINGRMSLSLLTIFPAVSP